MEVFGVIGRVGDGGLGGEAREQFRAAPHLALLAWPADQAHGIAEGVGDGVKLGAQAAARAAQPLGIRPPFSWRAPAAC